VISCSSDQQIALAIEEVIAGLIMPKYSSALYSSDDNVVHNAGYI
jgi:hypothetical protein